MKRLSPLTKTRLVLFVRASVFCTVVFSLLLYAGSVLKPARAANAFGGAWPSFLGQPKDSIDVMVFGTSHAFTAVDPSVVWRENGVPTFVLAGPVQRMQISERYVQEALARQRPKVVAVEIIGMAYPRDRFNRKFHLINVGYMPPSLNRLKAVVNDTPWGEKTGVLVDVWSHHNRWHKVTADDFDITAKNSGFEYLRGYIPLVGVHKKANTKKSPALTRPLEPSTGEAVAYNMDALEAIIQESERHGAEVVLFVAPTGSPGRYNYVFRDVERELARRGHDIEMIDFSVPGAIPAIDLEKDFYDGGHLNHVGAEKFSKVFAGHIANRYGLEDRRGDPGYDGWDADVSERDRYVRKLEADSTKKKQ